MKKPPCSPEAGNESLQQSLCAGQQVPGSVGGFAFGSFALSLPKSPTFTPPFNSLCLIAMPNCPKTGCQQLRAGTLSTQSEAHQ